MYDLGLTLRTSSCLGHLQCDNVDCDFLTGVHRSTPVNETGWEGISEKPFDVGSNLPLGSILDCKVYKIPPLCVMMVLL